MGYWRYVWLGIILGGLAPWASRAHAVSPYTPRRLPFVFDIGVIKPSLELPVADEQESVLMPAAIMEERLMRSARDETVEPLTIVTDGTEAGAEALAERLALADHEEALAAYLKHQVKVTKPDGPSAATRTIALDRAAFAHVDRDAFAELYAKEHHNITVDSRALRRNRGLRLELLRQLGPYLSSAERQGILGKIAGGTTLAVNQDLLPDFPRKMLKKFVPYRGPNCFHAALAFQSPKLTSSSLVNVKREVGYHRSMINYDELWRVLGAEFYEVDAQRYPLKYGDILVLFDVPPATAEGDKQTIDYSWIRHTATYLFSGYTFSKGSKSPNTPYLVRTVAEEWSTWKRFTKNLGLKVFRRSSRTVLAVPPTDLTDWVY